MDIQLRLRTLRVIQKIHRMPTYAEALGIVDRSTFQGVPTPPPSKKTEIKGGHPYGTH